MSRQLVLLATIVLTLSLTMAKILPYEEDDMPSVSSSEETADTNIKVSEFVRDVKRLLTDIRRRKSDSLQMEKRLKPIIKTNKRHCWDVADVCCMWNIC